jgi:hypothetical protein
MYMARTARSTPGQSTHLHDRHPIARESLFTQPLNYALILLLFSLLAYSSIGLAITVSPGHAEALPVQDQPSQSAPVLLLSVPVSSMASVTTP